jgi:hypothetical protein
VPKATKAIIAKRVEEVLQIRLAGGGFPEILQYAAEHGWEVKERQLWEYIRRSAELLAQTLEKDRGERLLLHLAQRRLLYNKAMEVGDLRTALSVLKDSADLQDLYPAAKVKVDTKNLDEAIDRELAHLAPGGQAPAAGEAKGDGGCPETPAALDPPAGQPPAEGLPEPG